jgi:hypothetical protein
LDDAVDGVGYAGGGLAGSGWPASTQAMTASMANAGIRRLAQPSHGPPGIWLARLRRAMLVEAAAVRLSVRSWNSGSRAA